MNDIFPSESGHWYTRNGEPAYECTGKNGMKRPTTLREARKLKLVPSVTKIIRDTLRNPAIEKYMINQAIDAALTLPRIDGESDESFKRRIIKDGEAHRDKRAEEGTEVHGVIERWLTSGRVAKEWNELIKNVELKMYGLDLSQIRAEKTFASDIGYGGKIDLLGKDWIIDIKTVDGDVDRKPYESHLIQIAAYANAIFTHLKFGQIFAGIMFINKNNDVNVVPVTAEQLYIHREIFNNLMSIWCLKNNYDTCFREPF